jgi:primosomal protein N' (replication factor Y) (superfamily II helicase)
MLADVVLPGRRFQIFTYEIPPHLLSCIQMGSSVVVPLGTGVVSGLVANLFEPPLSTALPIRFRHKPLRAILSLDSNTDYPPLERNLLKLVEKVSEYYLTPLPACLRLIVPPRSIKIMRRAFVTDEGRSALSRKSLSPEVQLVLRKLDRAPKGLLRSSLTRTIKDAPAILSYVKKQGWITERTTIPSGSVAHNQMRPLHSRPKTARSDSPGLFDLPKQEKATSPESVQKKLPYPSEHPLEKQLVDAVQAGEFQEIPVVGPEALRRNLLTQILEVFFQQGRRAILLTPEVHQAEALGTQLQNLWPNQIEVYHGQLPLTVRSARWERIRQGHAQVVVGTRSALFLPIPNVGLIWIDQENDSSYKDEHLPYYHAREITRMRAECEQALVIYGSTCPSLEIYGRFRHQISGSLDSLWQKVPQVEILDLRSLPYGTILSPDLLILMTHALNRGEQVILLLNRKGFSGALLCRDCGRAPMCSTCGVPMKLYHRPSRLVCSYCEGIRQAPEICPTCQGRVFRFSGTGTQRLEEEVLRLFPSASIARFDRENVKSAEAAGAVLRQFREREIHVLIGTELLLHETDPPTACVIGLPYADLGLHIPDFRSAERTFHMLSKAFTLAASGREPAKVILQTGIPDHHVLKALGQQRPRVFYDQELELREVLGYPPATHVILLVITGVKASRIQVVVDFLSQRLSRLEANGVLPKEGKGVMGTPMVLGPIVSRKPGRLKKNRMVFLIKTHNMPETQECLRIIQREYATEYSKEPGVLEINVDPFETH